MPISRAAASTGTPGPAPAGLLEQQGEGAALARPGNRHQVHAVLRAVHQRHRRGDVALMLEEVEEAPALLVEIMRRIQRAALRAQVVDTTLALHLEVQLMRLRRGIEMLTHQWPRWLDANAQQQNLAAPHGHAVAPARKPSLRMAQHVDGFHSERRGATDGHAPYPCTQPPRSVTSAPQRCDSSLRSLLPRTFHSIHNPSVGVLFWFFQPIPAI